MSVLLRPLQRKATVIQTRPGAALGPEEETRPGAAQDSVVLTSSGEAWAQCVDRSKCSTGICSADKPRAAQATVVRVQARCATHRTFCYFELCSTC